MRVVQPACQILVQFGHIVVSYDLHCICGDTCGFFQNKHAYWSRRVVIQLLAYRYGITCFDIQVSIHQHQRCFQRIRTGGAQGQILAAVDAFCQGAALNGCTLSVVSGDLNCLRRSINFKNCL